MVLSGLLLAGAWVALVAALLRWWRVAQREHYLPGAVSRFALRWWRATPTNLAALLAGVAGAALAPLWIAMGVATIVVTAAGPVGFGLRGRTAKLAFTGRLRRLAAVSVVIGALPMVLAGVLASWRGAAIAAVAICLVAPVVVDLALAVANVVEERLARTYVERAGTAVRRVRPRVVAITGSYGKTSTKGYVAHLLAEQYRVLASPRSFNNRAGLARTVNELLQPGTEVLVAEMGTYGPGEIAAMCEWLTPEIAVITAIGPVHLERFKTLDRTLAAKREITEQARVSVLNVDDDRLSQLANDLLAAGRRVLRASAVSKEADVTLLVSELGWELVVDGTPVGSIDPGERKTLVAATNVACAAGVALSLGVEPARVLERLATLPIADNRLQPRPAASGALVLDDTYNANPQGAALALQALATLGAGRKVVVTPGMIELGPLQFEANAAFAEQAAHVVDDLVIVGRTNRRALLSGARRAATAVAVHTVATREEAVALVRDELEAGDAVLYENDLPDHFP